MDEDRVFGKAGDADLSDRPALPDAVCLDSDGSKILVSCHFIFFETDG